MTPALPPAGALAASEAWAIVWSFRRHADRIKPVNFYRAQGLSDAATDLADWLETRGMPDPDAERDVGADLADWDRGQRV